MANIEIKVGQIWEVTDDNFFGSKDIKSVSEKRPARFHIKKGEKIEIRYQFAWNYRTTDNMYMYSDPEYILDKCKLFGNVLENVKYNNKANLEEILRLELFERFNK